MTSESQVAVPGPAPQTAKGSFLRRKRLLIVGVIVVGALGYLGYTAFMGAATYYLTVNELMTRGVSASSENVRVMGTVAVGSVQKDAATNSVRFTVQDKGGSATVPVEYTGVVPDAFKEGADVVMEGALASGGTFKATNLLVKCPSKYQAAGPSQAPGGGTQ